MRSAKLGNHLNTKKCTRVNQRLFGEKRDSCRHSTTSFSENVVVAETSYQMLEALSFCDRERVLPSSIKMTVLTFLVKNKTKKKRWNEALRGVYVSSIREKKN